MENYIKKGGKGLKMHLLGYKHDANLFVGEKIYLKRGGGNNQNAQYISLFLSVHTLSLVKCMWVCGALVVREFAGPCLFVSLQVLGCVLVCRALVVCEFAGPCLCVSLRALVLCGFAGPCLVWPVCGRNPFFFKTYLKTNVRTSENGEL